MAATTLFAIRAGAICTDGVCGTVSRIAGGRDAVDVAGSRPQAWPRIPLGFHHGAVTGHG